MSQRAVRDRSLNSIIFYIVLEVAYIPGNYLAPCAPPSHTKKTGGVLVRVRYRMECVSSRALYNERSLEYKLVDH